MEHISVLLNECIESLAIKEEGVYVDCTFGRGGHSTEILKRLSEKGRLIVIDQDPSAIEVAHKLYESYPNLIIHESDFGQLKSIIEKSGYQKVDGILLDLGVSSPQFDESDRGFSYRYDARLDMRMNPKQSLSAYQVINEYSFEDLRRIFNHYGEEKFALQIARKIEQVRLKHPIETTFQLVDVIKSALPAKVLSKKGHPAKQVFQAIRIEVNDELGQLKKVLDQAIESLNVDGRLAIISFHSLEDRLVKRTFNEMVEDKTPSKLPVKKEESHAYELLNKKAIVASEYELEHNQRAHSAKLRVLIKRK